MNRYEAGGASKATASTLCQKCLKRDIYECKAIAQERPYVSRPSRTQQLLNPKLVPKLTSDMPQDILRKKGVADEQLAKLESERGRKRDRQDEDSQSRSGSSSSSLSVASISTSASKSPSSFHRSPSPRPHRISVRQATATTDRKRRRSALSEGNSYPSEFQPSHKGKDMKSSRIARRKTDGLSPSTRGRRRSRSHSSNRRLSYSSEDQTRSNHGAHRRSKERTRSQLSPYAEDANQKLYGRSPDRHTSRNELRNMSRSPHRKSQYGRRLSVDDEDGQRRGVDTARIRERDGNLVASRDGHQDNLNRDGRRHMSSKTNERFLRAAPEARPPNRGSRVERSLSPFSKRLMLTQAMNMGR